MKEITDTESCQIKIFPSRKEMGISAGREVESKIIEILKKKDEIRIVFAAAPSQNEMLDYLASSSLIDWKRVIAFHLDEYLGLPAGSPQLFSYYLNNRIFDKVNLKSVHLIDASNSPENETRRYTALLEESPIDIICLGIGENGHIAFNDPYIADFEDHKTVRSVFLDDKSRQQQVNDGCFTTKEKVPKQAITVTVPTIMNADFLFCVVPGNSKRKAVSHTLYGPIKTSCPASILRTHKSCMFFFDSDAYTKEEDFGESGE